MGIRLLAIDTATPMCTVALMVDNSIYSCRKLTPQCHNQELLPMVQSLLAEADLGLSHLDGLVVGQGPGSFTGVRIAVSVAQGLALGAGLPVIPVSTLQTLAQTAYRNPLIQTALVGWDARMGEVYWGQYRVFSDGVESSKSIMLPIIEEGLYVPSVVPLPNFKREKTGGIESWTAVGSAWKIHRQALMEHCQENKVSVEINEASVGLYPDAEAMLDLGVYYLNQGRYCKPALVRPTYLRRAVP